MSADLGQRVVDRERRRRWRLDRRRPCRQGGAGRLHAPALPHWRRDLRARSIRTCPTIRARPSIPVGLVTEVPLTRRRPQGPCADRRGGSVRLAERQGRRRDLRYGRRRRGVRPLRPPADRCHRRETDARSLQGHRTGHERSRRRPDRPHVRPDAPTPPIRSRLARSSLTPSPRASGSRSCPMSRRLPKAASRVSTFRPGTPSGPPRERQSRSARSLRPRFEGARPIRRVIERFAALGTAPVSAAYGDTRRPRRALQVRDRALEQAPRRRRRKVTIVLRSSAP